MSINYFSSRPADSDQDLCSVDYAVDRFVNAVTRPFRNTPLSTRDSKGLYGYRRAEKTAHSRKVSSPGVHDPYQ
jgi:hypothetical protein